jgi:hypothetical protein
MGMAQLFATTSLSNRNYYRTAVLANILNSVPDSRALDSHERVILRYAPEDHKDPESSTEGEGPVVASLSSRGPRGCVGQRRLESTREFAHIDNVTSGTARAGGDDE